MTIWEAVLLVAAGILGGLAGSIAGLASVTTYPALLLVGLPPVTANVTNTVALVFNGIGSIAGSLPELRGQRAELTRLIPLAAIGGAAGATLLLSIPAEGFEKVVPILLGVSAILIALPRRQRAEGAGRSRTHTVLRAVAILAICVYGGFFGAAAGVLLLALFLSTGDESMAHANATKNVVLAVANLRCCTCLRRAGAGQLARRRTAGHRMPARVEARADRGSPRPGNADPAGDRRRRDRAGRQTRARRLPMRR